MFAWSICFWSLAMHLQENKNRSWSPTNEIEQINAGVTSFNCSDKSPFFPKQCVNTEGFLR
jgi:hypothetical protein